MTRQLASEPETAWPPKAVWLDCGIRGDRDPRVTRLFGIDTDEALSGNSHNLEGHFVVVHRPADNIRIAMKVSRPEAQSYSC